MTKEEILEKSREELQGQTISEEDVKIRKEHFMLSEDQAQIKSFYWSYIGFTVGYIILSWYRKLTGKPQDDLLIIFFSTLAGLCVARGAYTKKPRYIVASAILVALLVAQTISVVTRGI